MGRLTNFLLKRPTVREALQVEILKAVQQEITLRSITERKNSYWGESNYSQIASKSNYLETYGRYIWVFAAVRAIATNISKVPLKMYKLKPDDTRGDEVTSGDMWDLFYRPNPFQGYSDLIEALYISAELTGDAYLELNDKDNPSQLYILRPDWVEIVPSAKQLVGGYKYKVNGTNIPYTPEEIVHYKYYNPLSELYGMSPVSPSTNSLVLDFFTISYQKNFFKQGGMLNIYVKVPKNLGDKEFQRMKQELNSAHGGVDRSHLIGVIDNDGELKELGVDPQKFLLKEQRIFNREEVLAAFGVPPIMVGLLDAATFNNTEQQKRAFWENTLMPKLMKLQNLLNMRFFWNEEMECEFDTSGIQALQDDEKSKAETAGKLVNDGVMTPDEVRKKFYNMEPIPGGDKLKTQTAPQPFGMFKGCKTKQERIAKAQKDFEDEYARNINQYDALMTGHFKDMEKKVLAGLTKVKLTKDSKSDDLAALLEEMSPEAKAIARDLSKLSTKNAAELMRKTYKDLKQTNPSRDVMEKALGQISKNVDIWAERSADEIVETMSSRVTDYLTEAIEKDYPMRDVVNGVQDIFEGVDEERGEYPHARMIARTETSRAINYGKMEGMKSAGFTKKEWIAGGPPNDRPWHSQFGEMGPQDMDYEYEGEHSNIRYPGDPEADPGELCNCRCTIMEAIGEEERNS